MRHEIRLSSNINDGGHGLLKIIATIADGRWREVSRHRAAIQDRKRSAEAERMHPLDVPGHSNQAPLAADAIEAI